MKYIGWLVFILICFPLGQAFHRLAGLETLGPDTEVAGATGAQKIIFQEGGRQMEVWIDPATVVDDELPAQVTLKKRMQVSSPDRSTVVTIEQGDSVQVISRSGANLTVSALSGPLTGLVPISQTDLLEQVVKIRAGRLIGKPEGELAVKGTTPAVIPPPVNMGTPKAETPVIPPVAQVDPGTINNGGEMMKPPVAPPEKVKPPEPDKPAEPAPAPDGELTKEQIVKLMQESIKAGAVKEFTFEQVQAWESGEDESIDGVDYKIGLASYKAETIFGVKTVQAKALVKGGKISKWVYAKTGMEIR